MKMEYLIDEQETIVLVQNSLRYCRLFLPLGHFAESLSLDTKVGLEVAAVLTKNGWRRNWTMKLHPGTLGQY
jgi:hypothetical protein